MDDKDSFDVLDISWGDSPANSLLVIAVRNSAPTFFGRNAKSMSADLAIVESVVIERDELNVRDY